MVKKLDVLLVIGLFENEQLDNKKIQFKINKVGYNAIYSLTRKLQKENLIVKSNNGFNIASNQKAKELFSLIYFCFKNNIDYNSVVSKEIAEYLKTGITSRYLDNSKVPRNINKILSKNGMIIIESRKPVLARIIPSNFIALLFKYFLNYIYEYKESQYNFIDYINEKDIDKKIDKLFRRYVPSNNKFEDIKFIYSSLSLEGIGLTLPETEKLIKEKITPNISKYEDIQQTTDYKRAIDFLKSKVLTLENIVEFHKIAMATLNYGKGEIRNQNVIIKNNPEFKTADHKEISVKLALFEKKLIEFSNSKKVRPYMLVEQASYLHNEFQRIHPFIDGNSRTSRGIFSIYLYKRGFGLISIPIGYFDIYMNQTKLSNKRDDHSFTKLMKLIVLKNLEE
ncbi:MAG: Fic family protein [archaeon]|jgi:fido (protein-threonine AMPylation protein)